jgi:hypothetical protein
MMLKIHPKIPNHLSKKGNVLTRKRGNTFKMKKIFSLFTFLLDQKSNKKVKAAEIPPHNRDRIACRHRRPRASWILLTKISGLTFPMAMKKNHQTNGAHFSNDAGKNHSTKTGFFVKDAEQKSTEKSREIFKIRNEICWRLT